jgi:O-antigen ligase
LALLTIGYVVFGQEGRTTYVTLLALVAIFIISQLKGRRRWLGMGVLVLGAAGVFMLSAKVQTRFNQVLIESKAAQHATTTEENFTSSGLRIAFWRGSVEIFKQHPILGAGVGTWADEYRRYIDRTPGTPPISVTGGNPHQEYLLMAAQVGIIGLALFLFWIGLCLHASRRLDGPERLAAQTLLVAFMVGCWFNSYLFDSATGHFFCFGLGILFAGYVAKERQIENPDRPMGEKN